MTTFVYQKLTQSPEELDIISAAIGDNTDQAKSDTDLGKAVVMGNAQNYVLAGADAEIEGFIDTVRGDTVNEGFSFGGIQRKGRMYAVVGAGQSGSLNLLDYVVADAQVALGTKPSTAHPTAVKAGNPTKYLWRVIRIVSGAGATGSVVLLERN